MVCEKCASKLSKIATSDPFSGSQLKAGGRKVNENKALSAAKDRLQSVSKILPPCRICRQKVHQSGSHYCQSCAYKKGICAMCGKRLLNTKYYNQSAT
ncbi:cysteine-rich PDZ-binding protein [Teleopsis dalmanni]|uniref:cysteine-rich PDZ-binding protein n=1 Tax=Teleopsis dalmanni TaxID=139649 RepID=UPI0018CD0D54|nr:cysteine-rich PDZ-binding protein [Teleopsis dalmanni]